MATPIETDAPPISPVPPIVGSATIGANGAEAPIGSEQPIGGTSHRATTYRLDMTRDSANYALFAFGAFRPGNPMVVSEMQSLWDRLWVKTGIGGCARYERDYYHMVERTNIDAVPGNPWVICTLWHAQHRIALARSIDELKLAVPLLEWAAARAKESGVLAEQYHPYTGETISVSPLTWSHATVVTTVLEFLRKHKRLVEEANTPAGYAEAGVG